jgi:hypothetical protein
MKTSIPSMCVALAYNIYKSCTFTKQYKTVTSKISTVFYKWDL